MLRSPPTQPPARGGTGGRSVAGRGSAASIEPIATVEILVGGGSTASGVIEKEQPSAPLDKAIAPRMPSSLRRRVDGILTPEWAKYADCTWASCRARSSRL